MRAATRALAVLAALAVPVAGVDAAPAPVPRGKFAGKTSKADPVGFRVDRKGRVYSFYFVGVTLTCTDGDSFDTPSPAEPDANGSTRVETRRSTRYTLDDARLFVISARNDNAGSRYEISGRFKASGNRAYGLLRVYANFSDGGPGNDDVPDPDGDIRCKSGKLRWSADRR
jgi:hypothetical protein